MWILMIYLEPEGRDKIYQYPPTHVKTQNTFILAFMNYFDSDVSNSTNTVVSHDVHFRHQMVLPPLVCVSVSGD
jgi:hypothetical protein